LDALFTNALLQSVNNDRGCNGENVISPCQALWYYHTQLAVRHFHSITIRVNKLLMPNSGAGLPLGQQGRQSPHSMLPRSQNKKNKRR